MSTANLPPVRTSQLVKMPLTHSVLHPGQPWDQHATYLSLWSSNWWKKTKAIKNPLGTTPTVAQSVLHLIPRRKKTVTLYDWCVQIRRIVKNTKSRHLPLRSIFAFRPLGTSARHPPLVFFGAILPQLWHNFQTTPSGWVLFQGPKSRS